MVVPPFQMSCPSGEAMPGAKIKAYETRELLGRWEAQGYRDTCIPTGYPGSRYMVIAYMYICVVAVTSYLYPDVAMSN